MNTHSERKINIGIVGATGYTGVELIRLLLKHPSVIISVVTSDVESGNSAADVFPSLRGEIELVFSPHKTGELQDCDIVFYATPHATSMHLVPDLLEAGVKIIDLSADFRIQDVGLWHDWYGVEHVCPELLEEAVYGLPEVNREIIKSARLVANPGCYPTAITLALIPALERNCINPASIIADAKSGISGAGRKASVASLSTEVGETFKAYGLSGHRHLPEICQTLNAVASEPVGLTFVPHLLPINRGIFASIYIEPLGKDDLQQVYLDRYINEPFVDVLEPGSQPDTRSVRGTNLCRIALHQDHSGGRTVILSVIDNLVKGAAGQAIQNMNIMFDLDEQIGLELIALYP